MSYAGPVAARRDPRDVIRSLPGALTPTDKSTAFLTGVAVGALIGAGVALLLAPRSGSATRRRLARKARRLARRQMAERQLAQRMSLSRREASSL
jgi:gas vesicle protein